jgi:DNA polymerase I
MLHVNTPIRLVGRPDLDQVARIDRGVIPFTRSCQNNGMCIDREHFWNLSTYLDKEIVDLAGKITEHVPQSMMDAFTAESMEIDDFNPDSPDQIATLLFRHLRVGQNIELETTKSGGRISTGKKQLERLKKDHPVIPLILQRREYAKLKTTYTSTLPSLAIYSKEIDRYKIYYNIGLTFTSTGRMTCSRLHQIPIRTEVGRKIRQGFMASPGCKMISIDYSGLEMRGMAHRANERTMLKVFSGACTEHAKFNEECPECVKYDIHATTQAGLDMPDTLDAIQKRLAAKRAGFGILFGTTDLGLWLTLQSDGVPCSREQCAGFMAGFFKTYYDVLPYIQQQFQRVRRYGFAYNPFGRVTPVPEFRSVHKRIVREGERRVQNWGIQSFATDIFKLGAADVHEFCVEVEKGLFGRSYILRCLLPIHDQILIEASEEIAEEAAETIAVIMSNCIGLRVPLKTDWHISERWRK